MTNTQLTDISKTISCVSHEIRNHLSICDMYSQIIRRNLEKSEIENPTILNALNCIQQSVQIIESSLLDLKSISRNVVAVVDFEKIISKGVELSKAYIIDKDINIDLFVKNSADIEVDESRFLAVMVNIIKNGIESIEVKGNIEIVAEVKEGFGIIRLSNDGLPIPKDKQEKIFEQGYTTKSNGCGLGLAICRQYLEVQGATLNLIRSNKAKTTFEITVPVKV